MRKILLLAATAALLIPAAANAQAIITNGTIGLGVDAGGQLNIPGPTSRGGTGSYGLRDIATGWEATAPGCLCEGWGAAVQGTGNTVYANNAVGSSFTAVSFASTATTATAVVTGGGLTVTHAFSPSATPLLYQVDVTITNTSGADFADKTLYLRTMDWDIEPTAFREFSTIQGTTGAANVLAANNNGFCDSNALVFCSSLGATGDFIDVGPTDHGANFDFIFDALKAGASQKLTIFYGAAPTERAALGALGNVGAEIYSFGQSSDDMLGGTPDRRTFIFGFKGVGGVIIPDDDPLGVPEPTSWALMIMGFGFAGAAIRRRRVQTAA